MNLKISLIIPVYNVEKFLPRCLDSVASQTYADLEVIIVNDGSTDNSAQIIDRYVASNPNFTAYTIENSGQGGARNFGLEKAQGDYVAFLDSDDYIAPDCIEKLAAAAKTNDSDIVVCACYDVKEDGTVIAQIDNNITNGTTNIFESPQILFNRVAPWGKLFRRSVFGDLSFATRVWYEDMRLIPKLYLSADKITYIDDALLYYVQRAGSTMNNSNAARNLEIIDAFEDVISYFKQKGVYDKIKEEIAFLVVDHIAVATVTRVVQSKSKDKRAVIQKLDEYLSGFDGLYNNKYMPCLTSNKKLILQFNRRRLYFLTNLCMKIKSKLK